MEMFTKRLHSKMVRINFIDVLIGLSLIFLPGCRKESTTEGDQISEREKTLSSLKKINDYPFYTMTYYGDYGFSECLDTGRWPTLSVSTSDEEGPRCTCFAAMGSDSTRLFGRSLDRNHQNCMALLLFTDPPNGYASVSMVDLIDLGYSDSYTPDLYQNRDALLNTPYYPLDGMNECGVAVGAMSVDHAEPPYDISKRTVRTFTLIRLLLDFAKNVDEAIDLISKYNVDFHQNGPCHYLISDQTGNSVIIEFLNNDIKVIRNSEKWQVSTNSIIYGTQMPQVANFQYYDAASWGLWRYAKVYETLKKREGNISTNEAMDILRSVAANFGPPHNAYTMGSIVYNFRTLEMDIAIDRKYSEIYHFNLNDFKTD
jgi:hypothetical protein